ncbi:NADH-ubiquinone oxidoreductase chain G [hydrothermal vent metagenome]|uniref:NADH-ubiquinone oxidoreductase chain G n=1 Tax=hydrothermal vent metagenome TaxID=652676 RepID=A0A1W1C813_9ZZZZ
MQKTINFTIDGKNVTAQKGETILEAARKAGIYIPTMCYISKTSPCASCRICSVEVEGVDGFILSCNTPPTEGITVKTNSHELERERQNIMKLYDVNHPLECGVCDKSGECDLQNMTLEFGVSRQEFSAKDQLRTVKDWGLINYDPALCIMCEKCVHVCNEVIGDDAIEVKFGGYSSTIIPKDAETLDCTFCGECIAVCPVGALVSSDFKYSANAWELSRVPSTCAHCSAGCPLEYETRHSGINGDDSIYRVKNNFEFSSLCGAGRFGFDFDVKATKDEAKFAEAVEKIQNAKAIRFSSIITNEEAYILNALKEKLGLKLFNEDARRYGAFMKAYSSVSGKLHASATLEALKQADAVIVIGTRIATDNPGVRYALTTAARHNGAKIVYAHPMEDALLKNTVTQFMKYEAGSEEGVMALLANELLKNSDVDDVTKAFLDDLDLGYLEAESNVGDDELTFMSKSFARAKNKVLVVGSDMFAHTRAENIAKLAATIEKYTDFSLLIVPNEVNTIGASLICALDSDENLSDVVGYNAQGDYIISASEDADLTVPALNQQEGTVVNIDNRVLPLNAALGFDGYELNDLAKAFGIESEHTIDYTEKLPQDRGFKAVAFDSLENFLGRFGEDERGYLLDVVNSPMEGTLEEVAELPEYNGTVIYQANPVLQFNSFTNNARQLERDSALRGSAQFAAAAKISDGDEVEISFDGVTQKRVFKLDDELKGTIALNPTFDSGADYGNYRFLKSKIVRVV